MKSIPLSQGQFAKVSDHRYEELNQHKWHAWWNKCTQSFYARRNIMVNGKKTIISMHTVIMKTPKGMICDHKNRDTLDNQDENLRNCTKSQNAMNSKKNKKNTSGYMGVQKLRKKWIARLIKDGSLVFCKLFASPVDAAKARDEAAMEHYGEFAALNFPKDAV